MAYKALLRTGSVWISYVKWYKFDNNNLSVMLGRKQGEDVETRESQTRGLSVISIVDSLYLNFLVYLAEMSNWFLMKTNKRKLWKCLKGTLSGLRHFLTTESSLKFMINIFFNFTSKALFVLKIFKFLFSRFGHLEKRLD